MIRNLNANRGIQLIGLLGCLALSACSSGGSSSSGNLSAANAALGSAKLQGTWVSGCKYDSESHLSGTGTLTFSGDEVTEDGKTFSDKDCKNLISEQVYSGTYALGNPPDPSSGAPAIDYRINSGAWTIYDPALVDQLNEDEHSSCSFDDFKLGVRHDVSSKERCLHESGIGQRRYSVIKAAGNQLYMGDGPQNGDDADPQSRSTHLSNDYLTKE